MKRVDFPDKSVLEWDSDVAIVTAPPSGNDATDTDAQRALTKAQNEGPTGFAALAKAATEVEREEDPVSDSKDDAGFEAFRAKVEGLMKGMSEEDADQFLQVLAQLAGKIDKAEAGRRNLVKNVRRVVNFGAALDASRMFDMLRKALGGSTDPLGDDSEGDARRDLARVLIANLEAYKKFMMAGAGSTDEAQAVGRQIDTVIAGYRKWAEDKDYNIAKAVGLLAPDSVFTPEGVDPELDQIRDVVREAQANARSAPDDVESSRDRRPVIKRMKDSLSRLANNEAQDFESIVARDREEAAQRSRVTKAG